MHYRTFSKEDIMNRWAVPILLSWATMLPGNIDAAQPKWQPASGAAIEGQSLNNVESSNGIAIYTGNKSIIIVTDHKVEVRVFTILGQLVSHGNLPHGASILNINSRGIYIVKIENITQKVAL